MISYYYKAKAPTGSIVAGKFDAVDKDSVIVSLREKGLFPLQIKESPDISKVMKFGAKKKISSKSLAVFCRQFYTMVNAGVPVVTCAGLLKKQTEDPRLVEIINDIYDNLQRGKSLSESMKLHQATLPTMLISMIEVGEISGTLDRTLAKLAIHFEKENKIRQKVITAATYPAIIGCIALVMVMVMLAFIVPEFVGMFKSMGAVLPLPTRILLKISSMVTSIWFFIGSPFLVLLVRFLFSKLKTSPEGKYLIDSFIFRLPLIGINVKKILASRFTRILSLLLSSGVPLIQALEIVEKVLNNEVVSRGMTKVKEDVKRGESLSGPLEAVGIFPVMVMQMISIGEESGSIDSIMEDVANYYEDEVDASISRLISLLEPIMIFCLAIVIGAIVVSMMLPMSESMSHIKK